MRFHFIDILPIVMNLFAEQQRRSLVHMILAEVFQSSSQCQEDITSLAATSYSYGSGQSLSKSQEGITCLEATSYSYRSGQ